MDGQASQELMEEFAERTGLTSERAPNRYLWTDAFAVCNYVGLARETGESRYFELAEKLVSQVHGVLGKHRDDDQREGWLSGLEGAEAEDHPTAGGLRIGKPKPERGPDEAYDARAEWDRDGQYFHYLTKWMHALDVMARSTGTPTYHRWSRELAVAAHDAFVYRRGPEDEKSMFWKMSVDLSRPLVPSMGHHDPLDGLITCGQILETGRSLGDIGEERASIDAAAGDFATMIEGRDFTTDDPLGLGGLLMDATRVVQLGPGAPFSVATLLDELVESADRGLGRFCRSQPLQRPARARLAFRELGLAIGLEGIGGFRDRFESKGGATETLDSIEQRSDITRSIIDFWLDPGNRQQSTWTGHQDINDVMLATAMSPLGVLRLDAMEPNV